MLHCLTMEFVAQQTGTSGGVGRLHCYSYSNACTVYPKEVFLHGLSTNYSTNSQSVNVNLVQSLAINLPHTLKCNLQFTIIVFKTLAIVYIRTSLQGTLLY